MNTIRSLFSAGKIEEEEDNQEQVVVQEQDPIQAHVDYTDNNYQHARLDSKTFVDNVVNWSSQRDPSENQIQKYYNKLKLKREPLGAVSIALLNGKYLLFDGQHRKAAIERMRLNYDDFDIPVFAFIYKVSSEEEIYEKWKDVNEHLPLQPRDTPNMVVATAVEKISIHFSSFSKGKREPIKDAEEDRSRVYPYIDKRKLVSELKNIVCDKPYVTADSFYDAIKKCNDKYKRLVEKEKWGEIPNIRKKLTDGAKIKAKESNFYLGLDEKWSWLGELKNIL